MPSSYSAPPDLELDGNEHNTGREALVSINGKLPHCIEVDTRKLLNVVVAFHTQTKHFNAQQKKNYRTALNEKLYVNTRPGFYYEVSEVLHIAYAGQPKGPNTYHHWRIFCTEQLYKQIEAVLRRSAVTQGAQSAQAGPDTDGYTEIWGGLYLRSQAELQIAQALDRTGLLFFANIRGRVGLHQVVVSNDQLTGRVELDFVVCHQGRCMILEVDGGHHSEQGQTIRDYARDRVMLRAGLPTVRFMASDCLSRPNDVVAEFLSVLMMD